MNILATGKRVQVLAALVESNSIRSIVRMTGVAKNTIVKLLADVGAACADYQDKALVDLPCKRIQVDEIWSFCYAKERNVPSGKRGQLGYGDVWTWTAICADTKLVPCWLVGLRDGGYATEFLRDLASRMRDRIQLTSDAHRPYMAAVPDAFGEDIDYAMLRKIYGKPAGLSRAERHYGPPVVLACQMRPMGGRNLCATRSVPSTRANSGHETIVGSSDSARHFGMLEVELLRSDSEGERHENGF